MWPGVEPGNRGDYNMTYLQEIGKIVDNLGKSDIYVILDLHQDLLHRM
jgi:aryl-phospho-beta-D-glucosidase BglC (GH1 family)